MEVQVNDCLKNKIEKDKRFTPKTEPQITPELYAKWLTDKYNRDTGELRNKIGRLQAKLKTAENKLKINENNNSQKRLKYQNDKGEFQKELYKEDVIIKYRREIENLHKAVDRLRKENKQLVVENLKLKGEL